MEKVNTSYSHLVHATSCPRPIATCCHLSEIFRMAYPIRLIISSHRYEIPLVTPFFQFKAPMLAQYYYGLGAHSLFMIHTNIVDRIVRSDMNAATPPMRTTSLKLRVNSSSTGSNGPPRTLTVILAKSFCYLFDLFQDE